MVEAAGVEPDGEVEDRNRGPDYEADTQNERSEVMMVEAAGVEPVDSQPCKSLQARDFWC